MSVEIVFNFWDMNNKKDRIKGDGEEYAFRVTPLVFQSEKVANR